MDCTNTNAVNSSATNNCCVATTGCTWDGSLNGVRTEPIYVQKTYDAILAHLQAAKTIGNITFNQVLPPNARIVEVLDVRARKYFNPMNINDPCNFRICPHVSVTGAQFVLDGSGNAVSVIGPDGLATQKLLYTDTSTCDSINRGTPIFGTQNIELSGNVEIAIDVIYQISDVCDGFPMPISNFQGSQTIGCGCSNCCNCNTCGTCEREATLTAIVPLAYADQPLMLTQFFQLCMPSVYDTAFLPRFAEFCNANFEARLVSSNSTRDICVDPTTGIVTANMLLIALVSCEKKIVVPVQLCVLSTGFPNLTAEETINTQSYPQLFPNQYDEQAVASESTSCCCPTQTCSTQTSCCNTCNPNCNNLKFVTCFDK